MWVRHLRLWAGLLLAAFVIPHVINHALGLVYLQVMEAMRQVLAVIWQGPPGGWILLAAFLTHFFLALFALFSRSTLRMPLWEGVQIALGLLIFPLILVHVIGTAVVGELLKFDPTYEYVITSIWVAEPIRGVQQTFMMVIVWGHVCMGLNFWLRLKDWYRKWVPVFVGAAILIPVLAFLGFARVGRQLSEVALDEPDFFRRVYALLREHEYMLKDLSALEPNILYIVFALILSIFVVRLVRHFYRNWHGVYHLDIRGSTKLGEEKLSYDVLFILNQFFAEMAAAIAKTHGHYAQFTGDDVNVSARLEALTKEYVVSLIVTERVANLAGLDLSGQERHVAEVRGRDEPFPIYAFKDPMCPQIEPAG